MPKTLLLADDSVTIQKVVGISLANEDITLVTVENGDDAVTRAAEIRPDIVLADIVMPGKNGYEVCEAVKSDPQLAATPVLLLTGTFEAFDAERARQVGADGHITKPFEAQALVDQVNQLLARAPSPVGGASASRPTPDAKAAAAPAPKPTADVGAHGEGGDAFDFFDGEGSDPDSSWPTAPTEHDLVGDPQRGLADETVLLDATRSADDPAFDAAVEAAAFDAPGERRPIQEPDDSGFDLESGDLSMASTVPEVAASPGSMSFGEAPDPGETTEPPAAADAAWAPADAPWSLADTSPRAEAPTRTTDPLLDFDPTGETRGDEDATVLDPTPVQSFDVIETDEPLELEITGGGGDRTEVETLPVVEDHDPARVQSPTDADRATPSVPAATAATPQISPALEQHLHATLEKIAWEAFSDLSEQVVKQVLTTVEAVAWEVIPRMAEILVKEEIERMKSGGDDEA